MDAVSYTFTVDMQQVMTFVGGAVFMFLIVAGLLKLSPPKITVVAPPEASSSPNQEPGFFSRVTTLLGWLMLWFAIILVFVSII